MKMLSLREYKIIKKRVVIKLTLKLPECRSPISFKLDLFNILFCFAVIYQHNEIKDNGKNNLRMSDIGA